MNPDIKTSFKALISSDWNQCLAPCGPFDFISFSHPQLTRELEIIFRQYTGNLITLGEAVHQIQQLLPAPVTEAQMDAYLDASFVTYAGVPELIEWCESQNILFMINTTGMIGYFQRVCVKNLLPTVPLLSAHPMIRFSENDTDPFLTFELLETTDKSKNTQSAMHAFNIPADKVIIMGDSGGDGPHFQWGALNNSFLIANMIKPSLQGYCDQNNISIDIQFGLSYKNGQNKDLQKEMQVNFMHLIPIVDDFINK